MPTREDKAKQTMATGTGVPNRPSQQFTQCDGRHNQTYSYSFIIFKGRWTFLQVKSPKFYNSAPNYSDPSIALLRVKICCCCFTCFTNGAFKWHLLVQQNFPNSLKPLFHVDIFHETCVLQVKQLRLYLSSDIYCGADRPCQHIQWGITEAGTSLPEDCSPFSSLSSPPLHPPLPPSLSPSPSKKTR